ncbi:MAG: hypothetical protein M1501_02880 [Candidatus Omnitrophica bacterium]|nr:hypothetical protein [Candidatus Omnitrophota bacterium]
MSETNESLRALETQLTDEEIKYLDLK